MLACLANYSITSQNHAFRVLYSASKNIHTGHIQVCRSVKERSGSLTSPKMLYIIIIN